MVKTLVPVTGRWPRGWRPHGAAAARAAVVSRPLFSERRTAPRLPGSRTVRQPRKGKFGSDRDRKGRALEPCFLFDKAEGWLSPAYLPSKASRQWPLPSREGRPFFPKRSIISHSAIRDKAKSVQSRQAIKRPDDWATELRFEVKVSVLRFKLISWMFQKWF